MLRKISLVLSLLVSGPLLAYDGFSGEGVVTSIRVYSSDKVLIQMSGAQNPGSCSDTSYIALPNPGSDSGKRQYASLLSAYAAGKNVELVLAGCLENRPAIEQVWLK